MSIPAKAGLPAEALAQAGKNKKGLQDEDLFTVLI